MGSSTVKKMLQAGLDEEDKNLAKAKNKTQSTKTATNNEDVNKGGRPPLPPKKKRNQYTITLTEEKRNEIMYFAQRDGLSFSRFVELAVNEYMRNKNYI